MDLQTLIPANKFDIDAVRRAEAAGYPAIEPILPQLLEWVQDMNWPVADALAPLLGRIGAPLAPHILDVLRGDDDVWKFWVLDRIVSQFDQKAREPLMDECVRIINHPTEGEITEGVDGAAKDILFLHSHD